MNEVVAQKQKIPSMNMAALSTVKRLEDRLLTMPQVDIETSHVLHGGMYSRTITIPAGVVLTGAVVKIPTMLVIDGDVDVYIGMAADRLTGHNVIAASAGRKQAFYAYMDTKVTMIFPTEAKTVEQAEMEFTDDYADLMSRKGTNQVLITGE